MKQHRDDMQHDKAISIFSHFKEKIPFFSFIPQRGEHPAQGILLRQQIQKYRIKLREWNRIRFQMLDSGVTSGALKACIAGDKYCVESEIDHQYNSK